MGEKLYKVPKGGLFHVTKVKYSSETEAFLRELIRESKLSIFQRKEVEKTIKNGEPLPLPPKKTAQGNKKKIVPLEQLKVNNMIPRRRKLNTIQKSGAFDRDVFVPSYQKANHEIEKERLQEVMAFGKTLRSGKHRKKPLNDDEISDKETEKSTKTFILQEILEEIEDRNKFLERMETHPGQGMKYKAIIEQEIAGKLRLIEKLNEKFKDVEIKNEDENKASQF